MSPFGDGKGHLEMRRPREAYGDAGDHGERTRLSVPSSASQVSWIRADRRIASTRRSLHPTRERGPEGTAKLGLQKH